MVINPSNATRIHIRKAANRRLGLKAIRLGMSKVDLLDMLSKIPVKMMEKLEEGIFVNDVIISK